MRMLKGSFNAASFTRVLRVLAVLIRVGWVGWVGRFAPVLGVRVVVLRVPVGTRGACLRVYVIGREGMTLVGLTSAVPRLLLLSMLLMLLLLLLLMWLLMLFRRLLWL